MTGREAAYAALFALLQGIPDVQTAERRLRHWNDVSGPEMPYLGLAVANQLAIPVKGLPTKWDLGADLYLYVRSDDQPPGPILNTWLDAIDAAITPTNGQTTQTLGGTVSHCWIEGEVQTDEGTLGDIAVAVIRIRMLTT